MTLFFFPSSLSCLKNECPRLRKSSLFFRERLPLPLRIPRPPPKIQRVNTSQGRSSSAPPLENGGRRRVFVTTHWSLVLAASTRDTVRARDALARLCQTYWYPLYAYVRRRGHTPHDA